MFSPDWRAVRQAKIHAVRCALACGRRGAWARRDACIIPLPVTERFGRAWTKRLLVQTAPRAGTVFRPVALKILGAAGGSCRRVYVEAGRARIVKAAGHPDPARDPAAGNAVRLTERRTWRTSVPVVRSTRSGKGDRNEPQNTQSPRHVHQYLHLHTAHSTTQTVTSQPSGRTTS